MPVRVTRLIPTADQKSEKKINSLHLITYFLHSLNALLQAKILTPIIMASSDDAGTADCVPSVLGDEPDTSRSLVATLKLAAAKGYIDNSKAKRQPTVSLTSAKKAKLEARSYTIEEKREEKRDYRTRGQQLREVKEPYEYKPEINLEYTDDVGRKLETPKEAFRYMCHKFHGKGPGKNKIDKRLRKQETESKLKKALSTDVPSSAALMISKQKELQTPYIVLSKGK